MHRDCLAFLNLNAKSSFKRSMCFPFVEGSGYFRENCIFTNVRMFAPVFMNFTFHLNVDFQCFWYFLLVCYLFSNFRQLLYLSILNKWMMVTFSKNRPFWLFFFLHFSSVFANFNAKTLLRYKICFFFTYWCSVFLFVKINVFSLTFRATWQTVNLIQIWVNLPFSMLVLLKKNFIKTHKFCLVVVFYFVYA